MSKGRSHHLHQTPPEFALAAEAKRPKNWREEIEMQERARRLEERRERLRNMQMPAHKPRLADLMDQAGDNSYRTSDDCRAFKRSIPWY